MYERVAINKEYLQEALAVYIKQTTFSFDKLECFKTFTEQYEVIRHNITSIRIECTLDNPFFDQLAKYVNLCPNLKHLTARVDADMNFDGVHSNWYDSIEIVSAEVLRTKEIKGMIERLRRMHGLENFEFQPYGLPVACTPLCKAALGAVEHEVLEGIKRDRDNVGGRLQSTHTVIVASGMMEGRSKGKK